jgi:hypothetical protein
MDKLLIKRLKLYNPYWYAVRYTGDTVPFKAMGSILRSYGRHAAYWQPHEFAGSGAWLVRSDILEKYSDRFDNFEIRVGVARRTYERLEKQKMA